MENCFSTPHLTFQARVDFQWCVELEMESLLSIPYYQCGIPGECCISFHLYRMSKQVNRVNIEPEILHGNWFSY